MYCYSCRVTTYVQEKEVRVLAEVAAGRRKKQKWHKKAKISDFRRDICAEDVMAPSPPFVARQKMRFFGCEGGRKTGTATLVC